MQLAQGQEKSSDDSFSDWLVRQILALAEAFGEGLTAERQAIYAGALADIPRDRLQRAIQLAVRELKWFPKVAELRELANTTLESNCSRPGPEEAWARMPKGGRMEDDSVVWCEEERAAYSACRSLLLEGDLIGARMAFKERYEKELLEARSHARPVHWIMSAGYDINHRLTTLVTAVQERRLSLENALAFVPGERQSEFARMLPPGEAAGLLKGDIDKSPSLPGLPGILAKMRMEGTIPEDLKPDSRPPQGNPSDRSPEEARELREKANAQREFLRRSRNGNGRHK